MGSCLRRNDGWECGAFGQDEGRVGDGRRGGLGLRGFLPAQERRVAVGLEEGELAGFGEVGDADA